GSRCHPSVLEVVDQGAGCAPMPVCGRDDPELGQVLLGCRPQVGAAALAELPLSQATARETDHTRNVPGATDTPGRGGPLRTFPPASWPGRRAARRSTARGRRPGGRV